MARELAKTRERMLHVRDTIAGGREALPVGLITGPQRQAGAAHVGYPAVCGVYGPVRVQMDRPDIGGGTPGLAGCVPAHRARNDPPGGVASRTSLLPSCAGTPRIRRDEGRKPTGRGGLGQGGREPIRPGNRGVLPLATMIASVNCPRCLAEHVTNIHLRATIPHAIAVMIPCIGSACCGRLAHRQARRAGGFPDVRSCRCERVSYSYAYALFGPLMTYVG
jgi:hypothetical protein